MNPYIVLTTPEGRNYLKYVPNPKMKRKANQQIGPKSKKARKSSARRDPQSLVTSKHFQPELKAIDNFLGTTIIPGTGSANHVMLLNNPVRGTDRHQRIGRKIQIESVDVRCSLHPVTPQPTSVPEDIVIALVWGVEGAPFPSLSDLFTETDSAGTLDVTVRAHTNLDNTKKFRILKRKLIPLRICGTATGALPCNGAAFQANQDDLYWEWHIKKPLITQFNLGNTGTVTDIENGALFLVFWTDLSAGLPVSGIDFNTRVRFYD